MVFSKDPVLGITRLILQFWIWTRQQLVSKTFHYSILRKRKWDFHKACVSMLCDGVWAKSCELAPGDSTLIRIPRFYLLLRWSDLSKFSHFFTSSLSILFSFLGIYSIRNFLDIAYRGQQDNRDKGLQAAHFRNSHKWLTAGFPWLFIYQSYKVCCHSEIPSHTCMCFISLIFHRRLT